MSPEEKVKVLMSDLTKELERLSYNQVVINRGMIYLKQSLDFLQNGRLEDIRRFLESYDEQGREEQGTVRSDESTTEGAVQEVPREGGS